MKIILLFIVIMFFLSSCMNEINQSCDRLLDAAQDKKLMNNTWEKVFKYFESPSDFENYMTQDSILIYDDINSNLQLDWESLGFLEFQKEIKFVYKAKFKKQIIDEDYLIMPYMISDIIIGQYPARLVFNLINNQINNDLNINYKLLVECDDRVSEKRLFFID